MERDGVRTGQREHASRKSRSIGRASVDFSNDRGADGDRMTPRAALSLFHERRPRREANERSQQVKFHLDSHGALQNLPERSVEVDIEEAKVLAVLQLRSALGLLIETLEEIRDALQASGNRVA